MLSSAPTPLETGGDAGDIRDMTVPWLFEESARERKTATGTFEHEKIVEGVLLGRGSAGKVMSFRDWLFRDKKG